MRFLFDENMEYRLALFLRAQGHDVTVVAHDYPSAMTDPVILAIAHQEQRVVVTNDLDFGELVFGERQAHAGVILLRLNTLDLRVKQSRLMDVIEQYGDAMNQFIVVSNRSVRVRQQ